MIPGWWEGVVLAAACFRVTRLLGWDSFPPVVRLRRWATGEHAVNRGSTNARLGTTNERVENGVAYRRPWLTDFLWCPWCVGFWVCLAWYGAWRAWPSYALAVAFPFALSAAVGLVAKNLDP